MTVFESKRATADSKRRGDERSEVSSVFEWVDDGSGSGGGGEEVQNINHSETHKFKAHDQQKDIQTRKRSLDEAGFRAA